MAEIVNLSNFPELNKDRIPTHVAIIMDGNGRWAKKRGASRIFGHRNAIKAVRETAETCAQLGVKYLTLYAFSTENWDRPKAEVNALMELLVNTIRKETSTLQKNNIRLGSIGNFDALPKACQKSLTISKEQTAHNTGLTLNLALSYSGRWDMMNAIVAIAKQVESGLLKADDINEKILANYLSTAGIPDPDLMIRTSGEMRISNFLLWEIAYSELYFTDVLWPDFRKEHLIQAIQSYQKRERRFGKTSEQVIS